MTAVPSLKRSATSRASLKRFGSDLWIAPVAVVAGRGEAIVRTTPSVSDGTSRTAWGRMRLTGVGSTSGMSSTNSSSSSTSPR